MKHVSLSQSGFSLVEVLVAITILLLVMAGPMRILTSSTNSTTFSSEQVVAYFLAQEGLELVQLGRDNFVLGDFQDVISGNNLQPSPWTQFRNTFGPCIGANTCGLIPNTATTSNARGFTIVNCNNPAACKLYLNTSLPNNRARYTHTATNGNQSTPYTRTIKIGIIPGPDGRPQGAVATSTVTWRTGSLIADQKVELVTYLTNVYDTP